MTNYFAELEALTGKVYRGALTPVVFDVLRDTQHLQALYEYVTGAKLIYVNDNDPDQTVREESNDRPSFEKWFAQCERL